MSKNKKDLNLVVTQERIQDMELEVFYNVESSPKATIDFVAHFVSDDKGGYLSKKQAVAMVLDGRKVGDIEDIVTNLRNAMEEIAVPNQ